MPRNHPARRLALALTAITALALPGLMAQAATAATPTPVTWHVRVGAETPDMAVAAMRFLPREVWVDVGDTVHWSANSAEPHTVTFLAPGAVRATRRWPTGPSARCPQRGRGDRSREPWRRRRPDGVRLSQDARAPGPPSLPHRTGR